LLMVSGDMWQFNYPKSIHQPIPSLNVSSVRKIAKYYKLDEQQLFELLKLNENAPHSSKQNLAALYRQYQDAIDRWQAELASSIRQDSSPSDELILFTLVATDYLDSTRTAEYLWLVEHPQEAKSLHTCRMWHESQSTAKDLDYEPWLAILEKQITAAHEIKEISQGLLTIPKSPECSYGRWNTGIASQRSLLELLDAVSLGSIKARSTK